jgi:hypothetical protein
MIEKSTYLSLIRTVSTMDSRPTPMISSSQEELVDLIDLKSLPIID